MRKLLYIFLVFLLLPATPAYSQAKTSFDVNRLPVHSLALAPETHLPLRIKPRKYQIVSFEQDVGSATVDDNPAHVTAVLYDKNTVALVPRSDGASHVTIKDKSGKTLMARYVVVADPLQKYLRLQLSQQAQTSTRIYYCPNYCYETRLMSHDVMAANERKK